MRISRMNLWCCGRALDPPRVDCIAQLVESIATDKLLPRSQNVIISSPHFHFAVESRAPFSIGTFPACSFACISRLYDVTTFLCPFRFGCLNGWDARRTLCATDDSAHALLSHTRGGHGHRTPVVEWAESSVRDGFCVFFLSRRRGTARYCSYGEYIIFRISHKIYLC